MAAYLYDSAVVTLGTVIENARLERVESGEGKDYKSEPKYTLEQLLDPSFKLPRPPTKRMQRQQVGAQLRGMFGKGVKRWRAKGPEEPSTNARHLAQNPNAGNG